MKPVITKSAIGRTVVNVIPLAKHVNDGTLSAQDRYMVDKFMPGLIANIKEAQRAVKAEQKPKRSIRIKESPKERGQRWRNAQTQRRKEYLEETEKQPYVH